MIVETLLRQWEWVVRKHGCLLFYIFLHKGGILCQKLKIQQMTWTWVKLCTKDLSVLLRLSTLSFNSRSESENCIEIRLEVEPSLLSSSVRDGSMEVICSAAGTLTGSHRCNDSSSAQTGAVNNTLLVPIRSQLGSSGACMIWRGQGVTKARWSLGQFFKRNEMMEAALKTTINMGKHLQASWSSATRPSLAHLSSNALLGFYCLQCVK